MGRVALRPGPLALLLAPAPAWSQDLTSLVVPLGPPLVLAPLLAMKLREQWLRCSLTSAGSSRRRSRWLSAS
jgi:hypothetical protein